MDGPPRTLLYIEDNPANLELMREVISVVPNLSLITAANAEDGLEIADDMRPDIIVVDLNLPGIDGFVAVRRLATMNRTRDIPVIALSADASPANVRRGISAGFRAYLTKPVDIHELLDALRANLNGGGGT